MTTRPLATLLDDIRACLLCVDQLEDGVRPVLRVDPRARILIAGQAPGRRVHESGIPFADASGDRLRDWMGVTQEQFDDPRIAILPMGFCFPGSGASGDRPPRPECAAAWRDQVLARLPNIELTLVLGQHAMRWHLRTRAAVTEVVRDWRTFHPSHVPLPHPSPRNTPWLRKNPWFEGEVVPEVRRRVAEVFGG